MTWIMMLSSDIDISLISYLYSVATISNPETLNTLAIGVYQMELY